MCVLLYACVLAQVSAYGVHTNVRHLHAFEHMLVCPTAT